MVQTRMGSKNVQFIDNMATSPSLPHFCSKVWLERVSPAEVRPWLPCPTGPWRSRLPCRQSSGTPGAVMAWRGWWKSRSTFAGGRWKPWRRCSEARSWLSSSASTSFTLAAGTAPPCRGCRSSARLPSKVSEGEVVRAGLAWCPSSMPTVPLTHQPFLG